MKLFNGLLFICMFAFSLVLGDGLPNYQMVDLGLFETDFSTAFAVNEKGQVLGYYEEGSSHFIFIWDQANGRKIIDLPSGTHYWDLKLNGNGQIAGVAYLNSMWKAFYRDLNFDIWELDSSVNQINVVAINDIGQVLGKVGDQMFIWDHGKKINLTTLFCEQINGNWSCFKPSAINNHGHITFSAEDSSSEGSFIRSSFLWRDNCFKIILPEMNSELAIEASCLDDKENMIVWCYSQDGGGQNTSFFIEETKGILAECKYCSGIKNGLPIAKDCLHGQLKKDVYDRLYFTSGLQIKKLFREEYPYYNVANSTVIRDQNSKGYVVGEIDTIYPGRHAFLAIPETNGN